MPIALGDPRHGALALVVEQAREAGRREGQRQRRGAPEDRRRGVDRRDVAQRCSGRARRARTRRARGAGRPRCRRRRRRSRTRARGARRRAIARRSAMLAARARRRAVGSSSGRRGASRGRSSDQRGRRRSVTGPRSLAEPSVRAAPARRPERGAHGRGRPVSRRPARRARRAARGPSTPLRLARRRRRCHASSGARSRTASVARMRPGRAISVTRLATLTVAPNQSPPRVVAGPWATPTRTSGKRSPSLATESTSRCRVAISAGTSGEANIAPSPIVLMRVAGRLTEAHREVGEAPGDAPEVLGRELLAEARVADEVGEGDGDVARAGQAADLALGLGHELAAHAVAQVRAELVVEQGRHAAGRARRPPQRSAGRRCTRCRPAASARCRRGA